MSTATLVTASAPDQPLAILLFDYPGADIILRSQDGYHLQVPKIYILNSSPILGKLIQGALKSLEASLPVVQLPENGETLHCLLTFVFPVTPLVPSTPEKIMELLSVAQWFQMGAALTHIRGCVAQQNKLPTRLEPALRIYTLAQKLGLRTEALQMAQAIFLKQPMTIEDFGNKLDIMSGASLYELWKYYEKVQSILASDLTKFRESYAITGLHCKELSSSKIPSWLDQYVESVGKTPNLFDSAQFNIAMARHLTSKDEDNLSCKCASITSQTISNFWEALASVVDGSFEKVRWLIYRAP